MGIHERITHQFEHRHLVTRHVVRLMGRDNDVDTSRAENEPGWSTKVSYEEAMAEIEKWMKENMS